MRPPKAQLALLVASAALLGAPAPALAEEVPPENSAANQYTETYPTSGGDRETERADDIAGGGGGSKLDRDKQRQLQAAGSDGHGVVNLVEATSPPAAVEAAANGGGTGDRGGSSANSRDGASGGNIADVGGGPSATEEVLGQVTGSDSDGELGLILPLLVLATLAWAAGSLWRRRREA